MINIDNKIDIESKDKNNFKTNYELEERINNHHDSIYDDRDCLMTNEEDETNLEIENENKVQQIASKISPDPNEYGIFVIIKEKNKKEIKNRKNKIKKHLSHIDNLFSKIKKEIISKSLIDETKELFNKVSEKMNLQGKKITNIVIGVFYYTCRKQGLAKTFKEVGSMFDVPERLVKKEFNKIKQYIVENKNEDDIKDIEKKYIDNFFGEDKNRYFIKELAYNIVDNITKSNILEGKSTRTIAGISLFMSYKLCNDNLYDKEEFYKYFSNMNTLKKAFEEIKDSLDMIIPTKYIDKIDLFQYDKIFE